MFARVTFVPTLAYNLARNRWSSWNWYDRIDQSVVLGALPFHGAITNQLLHHEQIGSVVSMNENFELKLFVTQCQQWNQFGVKFLQLNTTDIFHAPSQHQLITGVDFILDQSSKQVDGAKRIGVYDQRQCPLPLRWWLNSNCFDLDQISKQTIENPNSSVYVHCKAGRTRSATLVACYLIKRYNLTPNEAVRSMQSKRRQILLHTKQWEAIERFHHHHLASGQNSPNCDEPVPIPTDKSYTLKPSIANKTIMICKKILLS